MKKPLPKVSLPTMVTTLPISKIKVNYRPFVIKEQKALLLAQDSKDKDTILSTIVDVLKSCSNGTVDPDKIPTADLAYFFIQLRIASVGPDVKFTVGCSSCGTPNTINMKLTDIKLDTPTIVTDIKLTDTVGVTFRLPTMTDAMLSDDTRDKTTSMLYRLIETMYDEDSVYEKSDYTFEEFEEWLGMLNEQQLLQIEKYVDSIPELTHTLEFDCYQCKTKNRRLLEGLHSFFRFDTGT